MELRDILLHKYYKLTPFTINLMDINVISLVLALLLICCSWVIILFKGNLTNTIIILPFNSNKHKLSINTVNLAWFFSRRWWLPIQNSDILQPKPWNHVFWKIVTIDNWVHLQCNLVVLLCMKDKYEFLNLLMWIFFLICITIYILNIYSLPCIQDEI